MDATTAILGWFRGRYEQEAGRLEISEVISLIEQAKEGDRGAFEALMRAYSGLCIRWRFECWAGEPTQKMSFRRPFSEPGAT